jgi:hypothetical protein
VSEAIEAIRAEMTRFVQLRRAPPKALLAYVESGVMAVTTSCVAGHSGTLAPTSYSVTWCATRPAKIQMERTE